MKIVLLFLIFLVLIDMANTLEKILLEISK